MSDTVLELERFSTTREQFRLNRISFSLEAGTITGLIGRNGMGKTTLLEGILGILPCSDGSVRFWGKPMEENEQAIKQKIGYVPDGLGLPARMTLRDALDFYGRMYETYDEACANELCTRLDVSMNKKLGALSKGNQMKASIVFALSHHPALLLLDEPTAGLDPAARIELLDLLYETAERDKTAVLLSTHITTDLDKTADYITLIKDGTLQFFKEKDKLLDQLMVAAFNPAQLDEDREELLLGYHKTKLGAEGMLRKKRIGEFGIAQNTARPTLEDVICYMG